MSRAYLRCEPDRVTGLTTECHSLRVCTTGPPPPGSKRGVSHGAHRAAVRRLTSGKSHCVKRSGAPRRRGVSLERIGSTRAHPPAPRPFRHLRQRNRGARGNRRVRRPRVAPHGALATRPSPCVPAAQDRFATQGDSRIARTRSVARLPSRRFRASLHLNKPHIQHNTPPVNGASHSPCPPSGALFPNLVWFGA